MKLVEYYQKTNLETNKSEYFVEIYNISWHLALWHLIWQKIDPCSKKLWRLWYPFTQLELRTYSKVYANTSGRIEVTRKWAKKHYDWDIDEKWGDV